MRDLPIYIVVCFIGLAKVRVFATFFVMEEGYLKPREKGKVNS